MTEKELIGEIYKMMDAPAPPAVSDDRGLYQKWAAKWRQAKPRSPRERSIISGTGTRARVLLLQQRFPNVAGEELLSLYVQVQAFRAAAGVALREFGSKEEALKALRESHPGFPSDLYVAAINRAEMASYQ
jgi:hypothetical protein